MAAPTISAYSNSNATDNAGNEATGSVSWNSGDLVVVLGVTEDNTATLATPATAGSGLSFAALSGFPSNVASSCKIYGWSATASATSSGTITSTNAGALRKVIAVWVVSGSDGVGNTAVSSSSDTTDPYTVSLVRAGNNSAVLMAAGDWAPISDTTTDPSPLTGSTQRIGDNDGLVGGIYNAYVADWADEGTAGTTSYGITGVTGAKMTLGAVEVKGSAGGGASFIAAKNLPILQAVKRASYW
jgi:hypothetical protein